MGYLRAQLDQEREANRENRRIIAGLVQRVPELEPSREQRNGPETASEEMGDCCTLEGGATLLVAAIARVTSWFS